MAVALFVRVLVGIEWCQLVLIAGADIGDRLFPKTGGIHPKQRFIFLVGCTLISCSEPLVLLPAECPESAEVEILSPTRWNADMKVGVVIVEALVVVLAAVVCPLGLLQFGLL